MQATSRSVPPRYAGCRGCCTSTSKCVAGPGVSGVSSQRHGWHPTWWTWFHFSAFWGSISTFGFEFPLVKMGQKTPQAIWITIEMVNLPLGERSSYTFAAQFKHYFFKDPFVGKVCGFLRRQDQEVTKWHVNLHFFVGPRLVKKNIRTDSQGYPHFGSRIIFQSHPIFQVPCEKPNPQTSSFTGVFGGFFTFFVEKYYSLSPTNPRIINWIAQNETLEWN